MNIKYFYVIIACLFKTALFAQSDTVDSDKFNILKDKWVSTEDHNSYLIKKSFDLDAITVPIKLRFPTHHVAAQLSSCISGVIYAGFKMEYIKKAKKVDKNNSFAISLGACIGVGNTFISPTTTDFNTEQEYDGIVLMNGVGAYCI